MIFYVVDTDGIKHKTAMLIHTVTVHSIENDIAQP